MKRRYVYIVWVIYMDGTRVLSAVFSTREEAQKYADKPGGREGWQWQVTIEEVYASADEV